MPKGGVANGDLRHVEIVGSVITVKGKNDENFRGEGKAVLMGRKAKMHSSFNKFGRTYPKPLT